METLALDWLNSQDAAEEVVSDIIETLWTSFLYKLEEKEAQQLALPYAIDLAILKLNEILYLDTITYDGDFDGNVNKISSNNNSEILTPDLEIPVLVPDPWIRGNVQTIKNPDKTIIQKVNNSAPSISSFRSSATKSSRFTSKKSNRSNVSAGSNRSTAKNNNNNNNNDPKSKTYDLSDNIDKEFENLNATAFLFDQLQKSKRKKEKGYIPQKEGVKGEFELLEEQLQHAAKIMQGKKFYLDRYNKPVLIGKTNSKNLPSLTANLIMNVLKNTQEERNQQRNMANRQDKPKSNKININLIDKNNKALNSLLSNKNIFEPTLNLANTLSHFTSISKVNPGVSVKNIYGNKDGENISEDPNHISKSKLLSRNFGGKPSHLLKNSSTLENSTLFSPSSSTYSPTSSSYYDQNNSTTSNKKGARIKQYSVDFFKSYDSLPDFDPFEGSTRLSSDDLKKTRADEANDHYNNSLRYTNPTTEDVEENNSTNYRTKSRLPHKQTEKQKQIISLLKSAPNLGIPRDRDLPINKINVKDRKKLPPPPIGKVGRNQINSIDDGKLKKNSENISSFYSSFDDN